MNNKVNSILIFYDIENEKHWINIKHKNVSILKFNAKFWNNKNIVFAPEIQDGIIESIRKYYG